MDLFLLFIILVLSAFLCMIVLLYIFYLYWYNHRNLTSSSNHGESGRPFQSRVEDGLSLEMEGRDETDKKKNSLKQIPQSSNKAIQYVSVVNEIKKEQGQRVEKKEDKKIIKLQKQDSATSTDFSNCATLPIHEKYKIMKCKVNVNSPPEEKIKSYCDKGVSTDDDNDGDDEDKECTKTPIAASENLKIGAAKTFEDMKLCKLLLKNIKRSIHSKPSSVQSYGCPVLLNYQYNKQDLMVYDETGKGKRAAFLIPILQSLMAESGVQSSPLREVKTKITPKALIMTSFRESVVQFYEDAVAYTNNSIIKVGKVYGGVSVSHQVTQLQAGCHILIGTPSRLRQLIDENYLNVSEIQFFILDDVDQMVEMHYLSDVKRIVSALPPKGERATGMFSSTYSSAIQQLADEFLNNHVVLMIGEIEGFQ